MNAILSVIGILGGWLFLASLAGMAALFTLASAADKRHVHIPEQPEVIDDALPRFFERRTEPSPWPDGDTVVADGMAAELNKILKGDGRDD